MAMKTTIKERPILFSGPMVRAILEGRKTQTRRVVKGKGIWSVEFKDDHSDDLWPGYEGEHGEWQWMPCPYGERGDRLWVRETFFCVTGNPGPVVCNYKADFAGDEFGGLWKPSIHMPRWASRITLEVTGVRVERLNEISNEDIVAEGIEAIGKGFQMPDGSYAQAGRCESKASTTRQLFSSLWESINGAGSWEANPWVWVVEFRRVDGEQAQ